MTSSIKAIIFDFGGVLVDWDPRNLYNTYFPEQPQALDDFLNEVDFYAWNALQDKGRSFADGVEELSEKFPHRATLIAAYAEHWKKTITGEITASVKILYNLKEKGYPLYGLSNWSAETFPLVKDEYLFFSEFDEIVLSGQINLIKPDPEIYNYLLNRIKYTASECLFIDDSQSNITAAKSLGFCTVHFQSPEQLEKYLKKHQIL